MTTKLQFCPHCGAPVTDKDRHCPRCQTDLSAFRTVTPKSEGTPKLNLNALYANPYREGMKRLKQRDQVTQTAKPKRRWWWPW